MRSLKDYLAAIDSDVAEATHELEEEGDWDARATLKQTMCLLKAKRHKVAHDLRLREHELRVLGAPRSPPGLTSQ